MIWTSPYLTLMNFLPKMGPKDLDQRDLERWDLAVKEDASQIELHLRQVSMMKTQPMCGNEALPGNRRRRLPC